VNLSFGGGEKRGEGVSDGIGELIDGGEDGNRAREWEGRAMVSI